MTRILTLVREGVMHATPREHIYVNINVSASYTIPVSLHNNFTFLYICLDKVWLCDNFAQVNDWREGGEFQVPVDFHQATCVAPNILTCKFKQFWKPHLSYGAGIILLGVWPFNSAVTVPIYLDNYATIRWIRYINSCNGSIWLQILQIIFSMICTYFYCKLHSVYTLIVLPC